jgi:hypothetical protein
MAAQGIATHRPREATMDAIDRLCAAIEAGTPADLDVPDVLDPDVLLDATVPEWRFHVRGAGAVRRQLADFYRDPAAFEAVRRRPVAGGELVEFTLAWTEDGVEHKAHQAHILELDGGRIVRDTMFCGGRWPAPLVAEMAAADARAAAAGYR